MTIELVLLSRVAFRGVEVVGANLRGLLALLAGELRMGCSTARLVDELWPDEQPEHPTKALQIVVSRARARLGADVIVRTPTGYRLSLDEGQVDASAVLLSASASEQSARAGDHMAALQHAEAGLALCEGASSWGDAADDPLSVLRAARVATYRALTRARALALSRLGRAGEAVEPLNDLVLERPRDEEVLAELLRCEAATVGPATALARYDGYRRELRDELGSEPGPALRSLYRELLLSDAPAVRHGVRQEPNLMLGRDKDIAAVVDLVRMSRVTSIVGSGGLGKTRLAHAVGREAEQRVVYFVGLAGVSADSDVAGEVASALGVRQAGPGRLTMRADVLAGIVDVLGPGSALLVLDNCEHVVRGAAELVQALVSMSKDLRVLTTSRAPLGLSSESVYPLPELDLPTMVELFGQRARAVRPEIDLPPTVVRELCGRLDGLPLAVELAAARVRVMSVVEIADRLDDRFALLRGNVRDAPQRHRTLHAVIDWSWHLLEPAGQAAMRALSVFPGGFTAAAARHILGDDAVVEQLVDQSLLRVADSGTGTRFVMLETVREFSAARREDAGENDRVVGRFLGWAVDFGGQWAASGDGFVSALDEIRAEQDNLLQALRYGLESEDGATVAVTAALLGSMWVTESNFTRLAALAKDIGWVLSHFRPEPAFTETTRTAAVLAAMIGFVMPDLSPLRALVALRRLPPAPPDTVVRAAHVALCAPDVVALQEMSASDDPLPAGFASYVLSYMCENVNDLDGALAAARRMLESFEDDSLLLIRAVAHGRVGELCLQVDPGEAAFRHLHMALTITQELGWSVTTRARWALVLADLQRGAFDEAERGLAEAVQGSGDEPLLFEICARAEILLGRGDVEGGLDLWRRAAIRSGNVGNDLSGLWPFEVEAVAVVTHARYGRLDSVREIVGRLPAILSTRVTSVPVVEFPICGSLLLALGVADLDRGAVVQGVRMIALAQCFGLLREFQPTMSPERITDIAQQADSLVYADAVSAYTRLDHDGLRAEALAALRARDQLTGSDPA
ncbi:putative ATPase/DNA-binding SARP family transcriptional activator [Kibdelosporangium banguiense]|uniref:ATPase/DNA-binding SARP family transcriptional activator n=1 Tax=Kibdelosporangium banguiense TaxID=1365924 RepID=A0ABS4TRD4_9PSEU|nr:BTAD domain-containing putative transcriptional regulator [Kibdelosporangium banguiense]MBP2326967.1 putative ATPase/DNA-binding SARP family transcriptional activator [Kibdelosporangium banguiense]